MSFTSNDQLVRNLKSLGLAEDTLGKLIAGTINDPTTTAAGTVQSTEYTVNSVSVPAGVLTPIGRGLLIIAYGSTGGNANAKNLKVYLGATAIATVTGSTANAKDYMIIVLVQRDGAATQRAIALTVVDATPAVTVATAAIDDTAAITVAVKLANTAAAATAGSGKGLSVTLLG